MVFCSKCGTQFEAGKAFCGNCGAAVAAGATPDMKTPSNDHELPLTMQPSPKAPKVYKSYWYITVPITLLLLLAWHNRSSVAEYLHISALIGSPLDSEAKAEGKKVFDGKVNKCGDKYYVWNGSKGVLHEAIAEFPEKPHLDTQRSALLGKTQISDVDRMNGLTWSGGWVFAFSPYRYIGPKSIGPWQEGGEFVISIQKLNGVWLVARDENLSTATMDWVPVDSYSDQVPCEKVSEYLSQKDVSQTDSKQELTVSDQQQPKPAAANQPGASESTAQSGTYDHLQFLNGTCNASSHTSEGPLGADLTKRQSQFFCDSAVIAFYDNHHSHVMIQFSEKKANHAQTLGFAGQVENDGITMPVNHVYLEPGKPTPVSDGVCKFFLEDQHMKNIVCVMKADEGGRRTVAAVEFNAAPGQ